jgi:hypothetical protein
VIVEKMKMSEGSTAWNLCETRCENEVRDLGGFKEHNFGFACWEIGLFKDLPVKGLDNIFVKSTNLIEKSWIFVDV